MKTWTVYGYVNMPHEPSDEARVVIRNLKAESKLDALVQSVRAFYPAIIITTVEEEPE